MSNISKFSNKTYNVNEKIYSSDDLQLLLHPKLEDALKVRDRVSAVLGIFNPKFTSLLDIGSNKGNFLQLISQLNPNAQKLYGVDANEHAIEICKDFIENDVIKFFGQDGVTAKLPFDDNSFEVVTFFEVLEHVRDLDFFLKEVKRVLNNDGEIYLSVPNATWWRNVIKDIILNKRKYASIIEAWPKFTPDQRDHVNNFNFIHLYRILHLNEFKLEQLEYCDQSNNFIFKLPYLKNLSSTIIMKLKAI
jgi:2-polyprenyl-3-methyl-5-hydroxy-6-metoxy-1,4-benzoquinol methylase